MKNLIFVGASLICSTLFSQDLEFSDTSFQRAVLNHSPLIDTNNDGVIQQSEADSVKVLDLYMTNINSIDDAIYFPNVIKIVGTENNINSVNIKNLRQLEVLLITANEITSLTIENLPSLKQLYVLGNKIDEFRTTGCQNIESLYLGLNEISMLDVKDFPNLTSLNISKNPISVIDLSNNSKLEQLSCAETNLDSIDLRNNPNLNFNISNFDDKTELILTKKQIKIKANSQGPPPPPMGN